MIRRMLAVLTPVQGKPRASGDDPWNRFDRTIWQE